MWLRSLWRREESEQSMKSEQSLTSAMSSESVASCGANVGAVRKSGYLKKTGRRLRMKLRRFFVLDRSRFSYYRSVKEVVARGSFDVRLSHVLRRGRRGLVVQQWPRVWHLHAGSVDEREAWFAALDAAHRDANAQLLSAAPSGSSVELAVVSEQKPAVTLLDCLTQAHFAGAQLAEALKRCADAPAHPTTTNDDKQAALAKFQLIMKDVHQLAATLYEKMDSTTSNGANDEEAKIANHFRSGARRQRTPGSDTARERWQPALESLPGGGGGGSQRKQRGDSKSSSLSAQVAASVAPRRRRSSVPPKPESQFLLWSFVKANFGRLHKLDLTRVALPVQLNEPLSILQRSTEKFEFADVLDAAARQRHAGLQMAHVAAFIVSGWGRLDQRLSKPFNPLLGETFECDRRLDLGWRSVSEQVSHHPPVSATWAEGRQWTFYDEIGVTSKYRNLAVHVLPSGGSMLSLRGDGHRGEYAWHKSGVRTELTGLFFGPLSLEQIGSFHLHDDASEYSCFVELGSKRSVEGVVKDGDGAACWLLRGFWNAHVDALKVTSEKRRMGRVPLYETEPAVRLWHVAPLPDTAARTYYLSPLAVQLNEMEEAVAPTDSRRRADVRLLEEGDVDGAAAAKQRLEEAQRQRLERLPDAEPVWFRRRTDLASASVCYRFTDAYWHAKASQDWSICPRIY